MTIRIDVDINKQMAFDANQVIAKIGVPAGGTVEVHFTTPADLSGANTHGKPFSDGFISFSKDAGEATLTGKFRNTTKVALMDVMFRMGNLQPLTPYVASCTVDADVPEGMLWVRFDVPKINSSNKPKR